MPVIVNDEDSRFQQGQKRVGSPGAPPALLRLTDYAGYNPHTDPPTPVPTWPPWGGGPGPRPSGPTGSVGQDRPPNDVPPMPPSPPFNPHVVLTQGYWTWLPGKGWIPTHMAEQEWLDFSAPGPAHPATRIPAQSSGQINPLATVLQFLPTSTAASGLLGLLRSLRLF